MTPLKKRKYRAKVNDINSRTPQNQHSHPGEDAIGSDTQSDAQYPDVIALNSSSEQPGPASVKTENPPTWSEGVYPVSSNSVGTMVEGTGVGEPGGIIGLHESAPASYSGNLPAKPVKHIPKVFDDPAKPSPSAWGENPYDKAAELNKGVRVQLLTQTIVFRKLCCTWLLNIVTCSYFINNMEKLGISVIFL